MAWVYRYIDNTDGIIKYVGIVWSKNRTLKQRVQEHQLHDDWCVNGDFTVEYITENIDTRTDAEYFESHYVSLYGTGKYYNTSKSDWGVSSFLPNRENDWKRFDPMIPEKNTDSIYQVSWTTKDSFAVKEFPVLKHICKEKTRGWHMTCNCGSTNIIKKGNGLYGQMYCMDCGDWVRTGAKDLNSLYTPEYNGEYKMVDGKIVEYKNYTVCYGRKNQWKTFRKEQWEDVWDSWGIGMFPGRMKGLTTIHTYALNYDDIESAKARLINYVKDKKMEDINSLKAEMKELKERLKHLPNEVKEAENEYEVFLNEYEYMFKECKIG